MTDNEIKKALECCKNGDCKCCPYRSNYDCEIDLQEDALGLINRQQAEIERLQNMIGQQEGVLPKYEKILKAKAVKEFAERLREQMKNGLTRWQIETHTYYVIGTDIIDNLVKEMVGESNV